MQIRIVWSICDNGWLWDDKVTFSHPITPEGEKFIKDTLLSWFINYGMENKIRLVVRAMMR